MLTCCQAWVTSYDARRSFQGKNVVRRQYYIDFLRFASFYLFFYLLLIRTSVAGLRSGAGTVDCKDISFYYPVNH